MSFNPDNQLQNCHHPCVILKGLRHRGVSNPGCTLSSGEWDLKSSRPDFTVGKQEESDFIVGLRNSPRLRFLNTVETCKICTVKVKNLFSHLCSYPRACESHLQCLWFSPQASATWAWFLTLDKSNFPCQGLCTGVCSAWCLFSLIILSFPRSYKLDSFPLFSS